MGENISGKDVETRFSIGPDFLIVKSKTIGIEEMGEEVQDDINGDDRSEFQTIVDGYHVRLDSYFDENGAKLLTGFLNVRKNDRIPLTQIVMQAGFRFKLHNGVTKLYRASACTLDLFKVDVGGRKERVMKSWGLRCREFKEVA